MSRKLPVGAELAVAQHLEDLLTSDQGQARLGVLAATRDEGGEVRAIRELAAWLAEQLVRGEQR
jgi:hypothetical protein